MLSGIFRSFYFDRNAYFELRFCMEHNGGLPHSAESHLCDLKVEVEPSVPMFYIYPTDGPGALNPGYERAKKYKRRQENLFYNVIDRVKNEQWFPDNAQAMAKMYPRAAGIRCDASAIRKMEVGDDPDGSQ